MLGRTCRNKLSEGISIITCTTPSSIHKSQDTSGLLRRFSVLTYQQIEIGFSAGPAWIMSRVACEDDTSARSSLERSGVKPDMGRQPESKRQG